MVLVFDSNSEPRLRFVSLVNIKNLYLFWIIAMNSDIEKKTGMVAILHFLVYFIHK